MKQWPILRDVLLFVGGLAGVLHETAFTQAERPTLLILFAAMMGLPAFLRPSDGSKNGGGTFDPGKQLVDQGKKIADKVERRLTSEVSEENDSKDGDSE